MGKLRDPSHVRALSLAELTGLCHHVGLRDVRTGFFKLEVSLEELLARSFPKPGDADRIRQTLADDIGVDASASVPTARTGHPFRVSDCGNRGE